MSDSKPWQQEAEERAQLIDTLYRILYHYGQGMLESVEFGQQTADVMTYGNGGREVHTIYPYALKEGGRVTFLGQTRKLGYTPRQRRT